MEALHQTTGGRADEVERYVVGSHHQEEFAVEDEAGGGDASVGEEGGGNMGTVDETGGEQ